MLVSALLYLAVAITLVAQDQQQSLPLRRTVSGQTITSADTPKVKVTVAPEFRYIGGDRFNLYDVAEAELHLFVEADSNKRVKRLYWVQFEGYLPTNNHTYNYKGESTQLGGLSFFTDVRLRPGTVEAPPNSDGGHAMALLEKNGYSVEGDPIRERLIHLPGEDRRNELMIIYMEFVPVGTAAEMGTELSSNPRWNEMLSRVRKHARESLTVAP